MAEGPELQPRVGPSQLCASPKGVAQLEHALLGPTQSDRRDILSAQGGPNLTQNRP